MSRRYKLNDRNLIDAFAFNDELKDLYVKEIMVCLEQASDEVDSNLNRVINGSLSLDNYLYYSLKDSCQKDIIRILNDRSFYALYGFENPFSFVSDVEWNFYMKKMKDSENLHFKDFKEKVKLQLSYSNMLYKEHKAQFLMYFSELKL